MRFCEYRLTLCKATDISAKKLWGTWVAQLVKRQTLDFGSGHDLVVHEVEPRVRLCTDSVEPAWDSHSLSLSLSAPHPLMCMRSLSRSLSFS